MPNFRAKGRPRYFKASDRGELSTSAYTFEHGFFTDENDALWLDDNGEGWFVTTTLKVPEYRAKGRPTYFKGSR